MHVHHPLLFQQINTNRQRRGGNTQNTSHLSFDLGSGDLVMIDKFVSSCLVVNTSCPPQTPCDNDHHQGREYRRCSGESVRQFLCLAPFHDIRIDKAGVEKMHLLFLWPCQHRRAQAQECANARVPQKKNKLHDITTHNKTWPQQLIRSSWENDKTAQTAFLSLSYSGSTTATAIEEHFPASERSCLLCGGFDNQSWYLWIRLKKKNPGPTDFLLVRRDTNGHLRHLSEIVPALADIVDHSRKILETFRMCRLVFVCCFVFPLVFPCFVLCCLVLVRCYCFTIICVFLVLPCGAFVCCLVFLRVILLVSRHWQTVFRCYFFLLFCLVNLCTCVLPFVFFVVVCFCFCFANVLIFVCEGLVSV